MTNSIKLIANGSANELNALRNDLAKVLKDHGFEVTEKGVPRPGKYQHVMYLTGIRPPKQKKQPDPCYETFQEAP